MMPPVFSTLSVSSSILDMFGSNPCRIYPFDRSDEQPEVYPYVTWGVVSGVPENYLGNRPDVDSIRVQIDVWGRTAKECLDGMALIRNELEPISYLLDFSDAGRDTETKCYRMIADFEFWV